ncbi:DUF11 domain-containing protein, partial [Pedobacter jejuensis]
MKKNLNRSFLSFFFAFFCLSLILSNSVKAQSVTASGTNSTCPNGASITAATNGLASPVSYQLLKGTTIIRPLGGSGWTSNNIFTDLPADTYTVKARGNNDDATIVTSAPITVTETYTPVTASVSPISITGCTSSTVGTLTVSASGGSGNLSYGITAVDQTTAPTTFQSSPTFSGLAAGSYKFWVKDNNCITSTIINTTGVLTVNQPNPATQYNLDYVYLTLQNTSTSAGGYQIKASQFFTGNYVYLPSSQWSFYTVEVRNVSTSTTFAAQPYNPNGSYTFAAGTVLPGQTLEYILRNTCDGTSKVFPVLQKGPDVIPFATCGIAQAEYRVMEVSLVSVPATIYFTDNGTSNPENTKTIVVNNQNDGPTYINFTPNTKVNWYVVDNNGKIWPGGILDFTVDLTAGNSNASFVYSIPNKCVLNKAQILVKLGGVPQQTTGLTYEVTSSNNSLVPIGKTGSLVPGPFNQNYLLEYTTGVNDWPSGKYTVKLHSSATASGCYEGVSVDVDSYGYDATITGVTKTATCGSFNFTVNGTFNRPQEYELVILTGPGTTPGTTRNIDANGTAQSFTNMPYGDYTVGLKVKGENCILVNLEPITFNASSSIDFDAINSGGFACGPNGKGDLVISASTVIVGATLEYSIDNGLNWQSSNVFPNTPTGTYPIKIKETACGTETTQNVTVIQTIQATINNNPISESVCVGDNAVLNINAIGGTVYTWTYPDGSTRTGKVQNLTNITSAMAGIYSVVVTTASCISPAQTVTLKVVTKPTVNAVSAQTACNGELKAISFTGTQALEYSNSTTSNPITTIYNWTNDNPAIGLSAIGSGDISFNAINTGTTPLVANITVTPNTGIGCPGSSQTFQLTVNPNVAKPTITGPTIFCTSVGATLTSSASTANQWYKDGVAISGATEQTYLVTSVGSYTVAINGNGSCSAPSDPIVLTESACKITSTKTIVGNPSSVKPNDVLTYNITLTNNFGTAKTGITVSDAVPSTLTNITGISNGGTLTNGTINWSALTVPANSSLTLSFTATVIPTLPAGTTQIKNVASVVDPIDPNNPELPEVVVPTEGKITSTKTIVGNPSSVKPNDVLTYNITLTNNFGTAKTSVTVSDAVPATLTNITGISNGGTLTGNTINWSALTVPANGSLTLSFQATVIPTLPAGTTQIKNVASVVDPIDP